MQLSKQINRGGSHAIVVASLPLPIGTVHITHTPNQFEIFPWSSSRASQAIHSINNIWSLFMATTTVLFLWSFSNYYTYKDYIQHYKTWLT